MVVKCKYCDVVRPGGIRRLKYHQACTKVNFEACLQVLEEKKKLFNGVF